MYKDHYIMVLNKEAGLIIQPDQSGEESLIERVWLEVEPEGDFRACAVHRLDRNTTGLVVVALHGQSLRELQRAFRDNDVDKTYLVAVRGQTPLEGDITAPLQKDRDHNIVTASPDGLPAHNTRKIAGDDECSSQGQSFDWAFPSDTGTFGHLGVSSHRRREVWGFCFK